MEEKETQMRELLLQKDAEMQNIVSQLLLFEAELRREQSRIEDLLGEKEGQIRAQRKEIERLKNSNHSNPDKDSVFNDARNIDSEGCGVDQNLAMNSNPEDVKNFAYDGLKPSTPEDNNIKNFAYDGRKPSSPEDNGIVKEFAYDGRKPSSPKVKTFTYNVNSEGSGGISKNFAYDDAKTCYPEDSGVVISSSDSCPSPLEDISDTKEERVHRKSHFHPAIFEDPYDSQLAVQKLRDGLVKIRAIQDVTNVKSLDYSYDCVGQEKKRIPYRAPQKMKDLKAKRNINPHKIHRPSVGEINNQVIL